MRRNIVVAAVAAALLVAAGAYAQGHMSTPGQNATASGHVGQSTMSGMGGGMGGGTMAGGMMGGGAMMGGMNGNMMPADRSMMAQHQQMLSTMNADDSKLNELVGRMKAAKGSARLDAMSAVISELVSEREQAGRQMMAMEPQMMQHMLTHMQSGTMAGMLKSMQSCPLAQSAEASAQENPSHAEHHQNQSSR